MVNCRLRVSDLSQPNQKQTGKKGEKGKKKKRKKKKKKRKKGKRGKSRKKTPRTEQFTITGWVKGLAAFLCGSYAGKRTGLHYSPCRAPRNVSKSIANFSKGCYTRNLIFQE